MMTIDQQERLRSIVEQLGALTDELDDKDISNLFVSTRISEDGTFVIAANSEGFVYLASIVASLALERSPGQHYHYDENSVLSECQKPLVILFEPAPWGN